MNEKCPLCGTEGAMFKNKAGQHVCLLCIQDEVYGLNNWDVRQGNNENDPISLAIKRLKENPLEDLLARRRASYKNEDR